MNNLFELDPYPGSPKILFIGLGASTHTHSWIDLLANARLNIRLFSVPGAGIPPPDWRIRTYICNPSFQLPRGLDPVYRQSFYPLPEEVDAHEKELKRRTSFRFINFATKALNRAGQAFGVPILYYDFTGYSDLRSRNSKDIKEVTPDEWLAGIIRNWKPDVIHTL